jgi:hypothetical protein
MKRWGLLLALCLVRPAFGQTLNLWRQDASGFVPDARLGDAPLPMGSLQKPFVAKAWIQSHPQQATPRFMCARGSRCWYKPGHGELGLARAMSVSCNSYFLQLAEAVPKEALVQTLSEGGFSPAPSDAGEAIGLPGPHGLLSARPSQVLEAYGRLVKEPWPRGEAQRGEVLSGLREAALSGTASGLGHRGYWAKTGTVPASPGNTLRTLGWVLAVDDAGFALLARRNPGTGREAAADLNRVIERLRPGSAPHAAPFPGRSGRQIQNAFAREGRVTVRLFDLIPVSTWTVRNAGSAPIPAPEGFLGAGASLVLKRGEHVGPGTLEISAAAQGIKRRFEGEVSVSGGAHPHLRAILTPKAYVEGILAGELPRGHSELRLPLAAAVLRFVAQGKRHGDADVCDNTHCAWFVGQGPRLDWRDPIRAVATEDALTPALSEEEWQRALAESRQLGPHLWTGHCGGHPLSERAVWGGANDAALPCPRHSAEADAWERHWPATAVARAFGGAVTRMEVSDREGQWVLLVWRDRQSESFTYDEAHRRIASVLGWDAMPSPGDRIEATGRGYRMTGVGHGHRVGLCLGE